MLKLNIFAAFIVGVNLNICHSADPIKEADFADLHKVIQPKGEESAWLSIAWKTDLWEARKAAAKAGKPILLWEMDGHPLGCT